MLKIHVPPLHFARLTQPATGKRQKADEVGTMFCLSRAAGFDDGEQLFKLRGFRQLQFLRFHAKSFDFVRGVFVMADARAFQNMAERAESVVEKLRVEFFGKPACPCPAVGFRDFVGSHGVNFRPCANQCLDAVAAVELAPVFQRVIGF